MYKVNNYFYLVGWSKDLWTWYSEKKVSLMRNVKQHYYKLEWCNELKVLSFTLIFFAFNEVENLIVAEFDTWCVIHCVQKICRLHCFPSAALVTIMWVLKYQCVSSYRVSDGECWFLFHNIDICSASYFCCLESSDFSLACLPLQDVQEFLGYYIRKWTTLQKRPGHLISKRFWKLNTLYFCMVVLT